MFSFVKHKKDNEVFGRQIRRICDLTTVKFLDDDNQRIDNRYNRLIPTLLCPWENDSPVVSDSMYVLTKDLSKHGAGLLLTQPLRMESVVLTFCLDADDPAQPLSFLGSVQYNSGIGGGFWIAGIALTQFANEKYSDELCALKPLAAKLIQEDFRIGHPGSVLDPVCG